MPARPMPAMPMGDEDIMRRQNEGEVYQAPDSNLDEAVRIRREKLKSSNEAEAVAQGQQEGSIYTEEKLREIGERELQKNQEMGPLVDGNDPRISHMSDYEKRSYFETLPQYPRKPLLDTINGPYTGLDPREIPGFHRGGTSTKHLSKEAKNLWDEFLYVNPGQIKDLGGGKSGIPARKQFLKLISFYRYHPVIVQLLSKLNFSDCPSGGKLQGFHPDGDERCGGFISYLSPFTESNCITLEKWNNMLSSSHDYPWFHPRNTNQYGGKTLKKKKRRKKNKTEKQRGGNNKKYTKNKKGGCSKRKKQKGGQCNKNKTMKKKQKGGNCNKTLKKK